jgi:Rrf2 family protein
MFLSKRGKYGLLAMITLAEASAADGPAARVQIGEIARREKISRKFLEHILLTLRNAGLVHSRTGSGGGYALARSSRDITLGQIYRVLDGPVAPIACVSQMAYESCGCPDEEQCGLRMVMGDVRNAIARIVDNTSLEDVLRRQRSARKKLRQKPGTSSR